ncbi:ras-related protein Rap-1b-like [Uloborus diversus]|uniref:ras-related protein Rap-1b-like n=1 Tax=Uloborus diversus TaxID=327109 RepID=UPI00240972A7|nr:ras-related protein Rap-1b-like [Uloborus diversus]
MGVKENKLVVLGAGGVGKTSLVVQYVEGFFSTTYKPTVEDYYRHTVKMPDGSHEPVEIVDTAGSHPFPAMRELSIRSGRAFLLVFSLDDAGTLREALRIWEHIRKIRGDKVPVVLVGNKTDLEAERQVTSEMVDEALLQDDSTPQCKYLETSAKSNFNVGPLFVELLQHARELERPAPPVAQQSRRLSRRLSSLGNINLATRRKSSIGKVVQSSEEAENDDPPKSDPRCVIA